VVGSREPVLAAPSVSDSETLDTDHEDAGSGSEEHGGQAVKTRGGAMKHVNMLAMFVLLVGVVGIYSVASSPPEVMKEKMSYKAGDNRFYEVGEDTTAPIVVAAFLVLGASNNSVH